MYEPCVCRSCGKTYLPSPGFPLRYTCRGCAKDGKAIPSRRRLAEVEHLAGIATENCSERAKRRRRRASRSRALGEPQGRERREAILPGTTAVEVAA